MIKCTHGFNYYRLRKAMINNNMVEATCPRSIKVESWDHIIKCKEAIARRKEFIKELVV